MKKVLYITYDGLTDPLGQSQILPYLQQLTQQGYQFTILSFEKRFRFQKEAALIQAIVNEAGIQWFPLFFTAKPPILSKMYDRYRMWQKALRLHKQQQFDMVHCRSYIAAEMGLKLKLKYGVKMLFDMRGLWADEKVDNGQWNLYNPIFKNIYKHYKKKERDFLLQADGVISLTQAAKDYLLQKDEYKQLSIDVIPCCADLQHFSFETVDPARSIELRSSLGIPSSAKVLTYLGSLGGWYMTKEMFGFFKRLTHRYPEYVMLILSKDDPAIVKKEASQSGIKPEQLFITYSTRKDLPAYLSISQWSIFFIRNTFSKLASSPTKHAEIMGMGIPVICNDIGDTGRIIETTGTGLIVRDFSEIAFDEIIEQVGKSREKGKRYIRNAAFEYFDLSSGVNHYLNIYKRILL